MSGLAEAPHGKLSDPALGGEEKKGVTRPAAQAGVWESRPGRPCPGHLRHAAQAHTGGDGGDPSVVEDGVGSGRVHCLVMGAGEDCYEGEKEEYAVGSELGEGGFWCGRGGVGGVQCVFEDVGGATAVVMVGVVMFFVGVVAVIVIDVVVVVVVAAAAAVDIGIAILIVVALGPS